MEADPPPIALTCVAARSNEMEPTGHFEQYDIRTQYAVHHDKCTMSNTVDYGEDVSSGQVGGVFKKILREGSGNKSPQANSEVTTSNMGCLLEITFSLSSGCCSLRWHAS